MPARVCVIDIPGLSRELITFLPAGSAMSRCIASRPLVALRPSWPAVTCSVQATLTTGRGPSQHGIVANGIATYRSHADQALVDVSNFSSYRREVSFWEQSNQFLETQRFWQDAQGRSKWKTSLLFFQHSMPGFAGEPRPAADIVVTPKPEHGADGKLASLLWTEPRELSAELSGKLGPFPLLNYWGPLAGIPSSRWIALAAEQIWRNHLPELQLVYVPHLDYDLQRFGPGSPQARAAVTDLCAALEGLLQTVSTDGQVVMLSEYAISPVSRCVQPNKILREAGLLATRGHPDGQLIDYERSGAFALVDHQIAHVYVRDERTKLSATEALKRASLRVLPHDERISHSRAGDVQIEAEQGAWLDYRWWADSADAPVFSTQVDIHRKPGYDGLELFFDPVTGGVSQDVARLRGSHGAAGSSDGVVSMEWSGAAPERLDGVSVAKVISAMLE